MALHFLIVVLLLMVELARPDGPEGIHLTMLRRGGRLSRHEPANLSHLTNLLREAESQYARSHRAVEGNRLVRRWRPHGRDENDPGLINIEGNWYTELQVGEPPQTLQVDVDMLSPDWYTVMTTSPKGSRYDTFASKTHVPSNDHVHPLCRCPSDQFLLSDAVRLDFPICMPSKASRQTLARSGTSLGLAPHRGGLARLSSTPLLDQLLQADKIALKIWSVTILDADSGILSLGGTIAAEVERAKIRGEIELSHFGDPWATTEWVQEQVDAQLSLAMPPDTPWDRHFKWTDVQGAAGWWTALMAGVWINGAKALRNQPVLFDLNCPFILAPPVAARRFYDSIGGTKRLPDSPFYAFPCLNRPKIAFEIGGWNFPSMDGQGTKADMIHGPAGGRFSLGKLGDGTGYCVGAVVETTMGLQHKPGGMKDVWVLGEPFFRGLGVVFDLDQARVGVRTY